MVDQTHPEQLLEEDTTFLFLNIFSIGLFLKIPATDEVFYKNREITANAMREKVFGKIRCRLK